MISQHIISKQLWSKVANSRDVIRASFAQKIIIISLKT